MKDLGIRTCLLQAHQLDVISERSRTVAYRSAHAFHIFAVLVFAQSCCTRGLFMDVQWTTHGGRGLTNHRSATGATDINAESVTSLALKWRFATGYDVSATPSLADGFVYVPGWNGLLHAFYAETGHPLWTQNLTELIGVATLCRTTPVIYKHMLLVGLYGPGLILALDRFNGGHLLWQSPPLDNFPDTVITMAGTVFEGHYYVGTSSVQELSATTCCTFQGSFLKMSVSNGQIVWQTFMVPPNSGFTGVSVWGSSPSIDIATRIVFIGTGNNYGVPAYVDECESNRGNTSLTEPDPCEVAENRVDSIVAISIDTGRIVWSRQLEEYDVWTLSCALNPTSPNCPTVLGPDYNFGEAPMLLHLDTQTCLVVAGQKSGVVWALDCYTGTIVWSTVAGPGGLVGGAIWGACTDGSQVYTNIANYYRQNFTLAPGTEVTQAGGWVAMDARTGHVVWSTANPGGVQVYGPVSIADGVVFAGSFAPSGEVYALDALTGNVLWQSSTFASIYGGFSISRRCIFGGNGYTRLDLNGTLGNSIFAFCLPYFGL